MGEQASDRLIQDLEQQHDHVSQRVQKFCEIVSADAVRLPVTCFYETLPTELLRKLISRNGAKRLVNKHTRMVVSSLRGLAQRHC